MRYGGEFQICDVKKKKKRLSFVNEGSIEGFVWLFLRNSGNGNIQVSKNDGSSCTNCMLFAVLFLMARDGMLVMDLWWSC